MSEKPNGLTTYESQRWDEIQLWRSTTPQRLRDHLPEALQDAGNQLAQKTNDIWEKVPGNDHVELAIAKAIRGGFEMVMDATEQTIDERSIVQRVTKDQSFEGCCYQDLRLLDLATLDQRAPKNAKRRATIAAGHGAAAGFIAGGATAAGAGSGGMAALPAASAVALAVVADTVALSVNAIQGAAFVGAHYGYDPTCPAERAMAMSLFAGSAVTDAAKATALLQIRQLALDLAAKRSIARLNEHGLYKMMLRVYGALMLNSSKQSIAKGVPGVGAAVGAGSNYFTVKRIIQSADHAYPERWILDKYDNGPRNAIEVTQIEATLESAIGAEDRKILDKLDSIADKPIDANSLVGD